MNPFLAALLGQQAASTLGGTFNSENPEENEIPIVGSPPPAVAREPEKVTLQQQEVADDFILGNARPVAMAREAEKDTALNSDRKGMFGVGGTLRDVLGILGDAFLVQSGKESVYMPLRKEEKWSDAMAGFSGGGEAERSAIERAMRIDPEATQEFLKQQQMNRVNTGNLNIRGQEFTRDLENDYMKRAGQIMSAAVASNRPELIEQAKQAIGVLSSESGIPVEKLMAGGDPRLVAGREASAIQNMRLPQQERMVGVAEGNLAARNRAIGIMAKRLNLDERKFQEVIEQGNWDALMDLFDLDVANRAEQRRGENTGSRSRPAPPRSNPETPRPIFKP